MTAAAPYPGLRPFHPDEVDVFFGREEQIDQLLERLDRSRFLAVVGVSGSGKSSLVKAGLIPALETGLLASAGARWRVAQMRPGSHPLRRLAEALSAGSALGPERGEGPTALGLLLATLRRGPLGLVEVLEDTPPPEGTRLLLVVDQFEEIFRYHGFGDSDEAEAFVALLLAVIEQPETPLYVVLTMRSDFLGDCALFEGLPEALNDSQFLTPRMRREQRRAAIEGPAGVFGAAIEPVLVNRLLNDMGAEPDQLPRMQHLLMRLWYRCRRPEGAGKLLTVADYEAVGGFEDALSRHADEAFEELDEAGRRIAENLFRALSERGDDQRDVRRPARVGEVAAVAGATPEQVAEVVEVFRRPDRSFMTPRAGAPLSPETVLDVSHESLIRQWRRLHGWVEDEALSASIYRRLAETARLWQEGQAGLWGPPDLDVALSWQERQRPTAAWAERYGGRLEATVEFLAASREKRQRDEEAQRRSLAAAEEQRRVRQRNRLLTGGLLLAAALLLLAFSQWRRADRQRDLARRQAALAQGGELVAQAQEALQDRPQRSLLLALEALALEREAGVGNESPVQAIQQGLSASGGRALAGHLGAVGEIAVSPDGRWLATGSRDGSARLWELGAGDPGAGPRLLNGHDGGVTALAFDRGGRWLVSAGKDGVVRLWDLGAGDPGAGPRLLAGRPGAAAALAVGGGRWLATGGEDGAVWLWDLSDRDPGAGPRSLGSHADTVTAAALSADDRWLATASKDHTVALWDLAGPDAGALRIPLVGHRGPVEAVVFTPDGRWLATAGRDNTARLWSLADPAGEQLVLCGHDGSVVAVEVSPDGRWLITGSSDATARVWQLQALVAGAAKVPRAPGRPVVAAADGPQRCRHLLTDDGKSSAVMWDLRDLQPAISSPLTGHRDTVTALALSPTPPGLTGRFLATASLDHTVRVWSLSADDPGQTSLLLRGHDGAVSALAFNPRAPWLYSGSADASARAWNLKFADKTLFSLVLSGALDAVRALALSADGRWLVAGSDDNDAHLWDLRHVEPPQRLSGHDSSITAVGMSPDSRWLATASEDNTIRLWDLSALPGVPPARVLSGNASSVTSLAFTPDSRRLATAGRDGTARIWSLEAADPAAAPTVLCGHRDAVTSLVASADGRWLATAGSDGMARLWDLAAFEALLPTAERAAPVLAAALGEGFCRRQTRDGEAIEVRRVEPGAARSLQAREGDITAITFVPPAEPAAAGWLAAGDSAGYVSLFSLDAGTGGEPRAFRGRQGVVSGIAASVDGRWLAIAGEDDTAQLIDLAAPAGARVLALRDHRDAVIALAFSPDGRWLATGSADGEARLWNLAGANPGAAPGVLYGHLGAVTSVVFSPDGRWLATGSRDHTVRAWATYLWWLGEAELVDLACRVAGRDLTEAEWEQYLPGHPYRRTCSGP